MLPQIHEKNLQWDSFLPGWRSHPERVIQIEDVPRVLKVARGLGDGGVCSGLSVCRRGERHQRRATGPCVSPCPTLPIRALKRCTRDDELQGFCGLSGCEALQETEEQREASLPDSGGNSSPAPRPQGGPARWAGPFSKGRRPSAGGRRGGAPRRPLPGYAPTPGLSFQFTSGHQKL